MRNVCIAILLALMPLSGAQAGDPLTEAQLKEVFVGNTVYGEHARKGWEAIRYLNADGVMSQYLVNKNSRNEGHWSIKGTEFCWGVERNRTTCGTWVKSGEEYHFLKEHGKHVFTIKKVAKGNPEKL